MADNDGEDAAKFERPFPRVEIDYITRRPANAAPRRAAPGQVPEDSESDHQDSDAELDAASESDSDNDERRQVRRRARSMDSDEFMRELLRAVEAGRRWGIDDPSLAAAGEERELTVNIQYKFSGLRAERVMRRLKERLAGDPEWTHIRRRDRRGRSPDEDRAARIHDRRRRRLLDNSAVKTVARAAAQLRRAVVSAKDTVLWLGTQAKDKIRSALEQVGRSLAYVPFKRGLIWVAYGTSILFIAVKLVARDASAYQPWLPSTTPPFALEPSTHAFCAPDIVSMAFPNIFALTRPGHVAPYLGSPFTPPWGHYSRSGEQEIMAKCFHPDKIAVRMKQSGRTEESLLLERDVHQWAFDALRSAQEEYSGSKKEKTDEQLLRTRAELEKRIGIELNLPTDDTSFHGSNRTQDIRLLVPLQYRLLATIWQDYLPGSRSQFWRYLEVLSQDMVVQLGKNPSISPMHVVRGSTVGHRLVPYNELFFHHATWMWPPAWQLHVPTDDAYIGWPADDGEWRGEGDPSSGLGEDLQFWVSAAATSLTSRLLQEFKNTPRDLINAPKNLTGLVQRWFLSLESGEKRQPKKRCGSSTG